MDDTRIRTGAKAPVLLFLALIFLLPSLIVGSLATAKADPLRGELLSKEHCIRCHVVSEEDRFSGISSTPSFMLLVNAFDDWEERFMTFHARRPHPAIIRIDGFSYQTEIPPNAAPITITLDDVDAILSYARSLKED